MKVRNTLCSWSGGKDSCFALIKAIDQGYNPAALLNVLNEDGQISRSHGIPRNILEAQAFKIGLPIQPIESSWNDYEHKFTTQLKYLKTKYDLEYAVFGDIDLQAHRDWEEKVCANAGLTAILPLWKKDRKELVLQMIASGIGTMIVSCNEAMGEKFLGRILDEQVIEELEAMGVDVCGENGEYHTLVLNCSLFTEPVAVSVVNKRQHQNYWFTELQLKG